MPHRLLNYQGPGIGQGIGFAGGFIPADTVKAREAQGDTGFMSGGRMDSIKGDFHYQFFFYFPDRAESPHRITPYPVIQLSEFFVGKA